MADPTNWRERMLWEWIPEDLQKKDPSLKGTALDDAVTVEFATWPMLYLKAERNKRLAETDWWSGSDLTMTSEQTAYRKALRDLPATSSPELDTDAHLLNVTWPTKPE